MEKFLQSATNQSASTSEKSVAKKRKRTISSADDDGQPAEKYLELSQLFTLERFSDEVLIEIFKYLDTNAILSLESTCSRFCGLVKDYRLWDNIDTMSQSRSTNELKMLLQRAHKNTKLIKIKGIEKDCLAKKMKRDCLLRYVIPKCEHLVDLELEHVHIDFTKISVQEFPKNLKRLVFRHISVRWPDDAHTIFKTIDRSLIWLEELGVEYCVWFHPYDIMLFSKCPSLKKLSLRGCQSLSDFVPYGSMASRFGFKTLESLDARDTPITDSDLQCFNAILTLKELLLECPTYLRVAAANRKCATSSSASTSANRCNAVTQPSSSPSSSSSNSSSGDSNVVIELMPDRVGRLGTVHMPRGISDVVMTINMSQYIRPADRVNGNAPADSPNHFHRILRNPHFWSMIERHPNNDPHGSCTANRTQASPITNRGISCFGRPANPIDQKIIWIRIGNRPTNNTFERLCLRHYKRVTDNALKHLVQCSPNLIYLDVTGTGVTEKGITEFKAGKPECEVLCENIQN